MASYKNIFKITNNDTLPIQGSLLISEPFSRDAYFQRSVVLLVEHTIHGSMGFIVNKKTDLTVNSFFDEFELCPKMPIYLGGPVSANHLFFIHSLGEQILPDSLRINESLYFDGNFEALKRYITSGHSIEGKVKFFLGYSGWSEGQLAREIKHNSWAVSRTMATDILTAEGEEYWKNSVKLLGKDFLAWTKYPKDPYLN
ncbi:MAG TPA: YqgE/AlgH family protein [Candidatus Parabacteroides intestinigallinarum]|uniref:UPF0301 protein H9848_06600 n=1 Tax=Candidatus Parabacteroides intestinigallinarum TaxID=2838722 RepID=A0A9D2BQ20_9BACT|nr:YqgE/AlgH family protein [Candidatus Parabacteroides intestinigallinarum]